MRDSVIIYTSIKESLDMMTDEQAGQLFKAIINYQRGEEVNLDGLLMALFQQIKRQIDDNNEKYDAKIKAKSEAGKKGMAKRWGSVTNDNSVITENNTVITTDNTVITKDNKAYQDVTKITDNVYVNVNDNVYVNNKENIPPTLEEVKEYCKERKNNVDAERFIDFYASKGWMIGKNKMKSWKACIRTWEKGDKEQPKKMTSDNDMLSQIEKLAIGGNL